MAINVIRVEGTDGYGMFIQKSDKHGECEDRIFHPSDEFPLLNYRHMFFNSPIEDGIDRRTFKNEAFCGYKTVDQLKNWVTQRELEIMIANGFKVFLYVVEDYKEGEHQIVFTKESATEKKDISSLFINK